MASFFHATVAEFLAQTNEHVFAQLTLGYANRGFTTQFTDQTLTWGRDVHSLRATRWSDALLHLAPPTPGV